jgi:hypothetical protein
MNGALGWFGPPYGSTDLADLSFLTWWSAAWDIRIRPGTIGLANYGVSIGD